MTKLSVPFLYRIDRAVCVFKEEDSLRPFHVLLSFRLWRFFLCHFLKELYLLHFLIQPVNDITNHLFEHSAYHRQFYRFIAIKFPLPFVVDYALLVPSNDVFSVSVFCGNAQLYVTSDIVAFLADVTNVADIQSEFLQLSYLVDIAKEEGSSFFALFAVTDHTVNSVQIHLAVIGRSLKGLFPFLAFLLHSAEKTFFSIFQ